MAGEGGCEEVSECVVVGALGLACAWSGEVGGDFVGEGSFAFGVPLADERAVVVDVEAEGGIGWVVVEGFESCGRGVLDFVDFD